PLPTAPLLLSSLFSFYCSPAHRALPSFPTRRSSDLRVGAAGARLGRRRLDPHPRQLLRARRSQADFWARAHVPRGGRQRIGRPRDRKSTRLNSSHVSISYAVFCLKKKKKNKTRHIEI